MFRTFARALAAIAVVCTVVGGALVLNEEYGKADSENAEGSKGSKGSGGSDTAAESAADTFTGVRRMRVDGHRVNVSCSGRTGAEELLVMLMPGGGEGLDNMGPLQKSLSKDLRVCSYDRPGEGASDKPDGTQHIEDSSRILTQVLDRLAGDRPVVLAGHSLGGYIAARYTPAHTDRVKGLVLLDATIPHLTRDMKRTIPADAEGAAAQMRDGAIAANQGQNPERFVIADGAVRPAGRIPVRILKHEHESQYAQVPGYGPALERMWAEGQKEWRGISRDSRLSTAKGSGHYIHKDRPDLALQAVRDITGRVAHQG